MSVPTHPYKAQPDKAFWSRSIGKVNFLELHDLWASIVLTRKDWVATAGSCFAQHIGERLIRRGAAFMNMEPAPPIFSSDGEARRWGYNVFSCRYGNIYTSRQLVQ